MMIKRCNPILSRLLIVLLTVSVPVAQVQSIPFGSLFSSIFGGGKNKSATEKPGKKQTQPKKKSKQKKDKTFRYIVGAACAVAAFLGGWFVWHKRDSIYTWLFGALNKIVTVGASECRGRERRLADNVTLQQVKVQKQEGLTCGYHAVKNALLMANELAQNKGDMYGKLNDGDVADNLFGYEDDQAAGKWRKERIRVRREFVDLGSLSEADLDGENLMNNEIEKIISDAQRDGDVLDSGVNCTIKVIAPLDTNSGTIRQTEVAFGLCRNHLNYAGAQMYGFVVKLGGHWISLVIHKDAQGHHTHVIADSMNYLRLNNPVVKEIVNAISGNGKNLWEV